MEIRGMTKLLALLCCVAVLASFAACASTSGGVYVGSQPEARPGPPPHAPAWGYRAKHTYYYYPDTQVYFDTGQNLYFYLDGGEWRVSASLPLDLRLQLGDHVVIESDSDKPYLEADKHKAKYPPGQKKKAK